MATEASRQVPATTRVLTERRNNQLLFSDVHLADVNLGKQHKKKRLIFKRHHCFLRQDDVEGAEEQSDGGADVYGVVVAIEDVGEGAAQQQPDEIGTGAGYEKQGGNGEKVCETAGIREDKAAEDADFENEDFGVCKLNYHSVQEGAVAFVISRLASVTPHSVSEPDQIRGTQVLEIDYIRAEGLAEKMGKEGHSQDGYSCSGQKPQPHTHRAGPAVTDRHSQRIDVRRSGRVSDDQNLKQKCR